MGLKGFVPIGGQSEQGKELHKTAKEIYALVQPSGQKRAAAEVGPEPKRRRDGTDMATSDEQPADHSCGNAPFGTAPGLSGSSKAEGGHSQSCQPTSSQGVSIGAALCHRRWPEERFGPWPGPPPTPPPGDIAQGSSSSSPTPPSSPGSSAERVHFWGSIWPAEVFGAWPGPPKMTQQMAKALRVDHHVQVVSSQAAKLYKVVEILRDPFCESEGCLLIVGSQQEKDELERELLCYGFQPDEAFYSIEIGDGGHGKAGVCISLSAPADVDSYIGRACRCSREGKQPENRGRPPCSSSVRQTGLAAEGLMDPTSEAEPSCHAST